MWQGQWPTSQNQIDQAVAIRSDRCAGVIGVDSGLSHLAVALNLPHVQIYNFNTDWRTGPLNNSGQCSVMDVNSPSVEKVWQAWEQVQSGWISTSDEFAKSMMSTLPA